MASPKTQDLDQITRPEARRIACLSYLGAGAALLWIAQACILAWAFAALVETRLGMGALLACAAGFLGLAVLRAGITALAEDRLDAAARRIVLAQQQQVVAQQQWVSPYEPRVRSSAVVAALISDKLPLLVPYLTRYRPAMTRVMIVPLVILAVAFSLSWAVGLVLLLAGPLIPVFMALIGMAAQEASEKQMDELSDLNDLLLERLGALVDIKLLSAEPFVSAEFFQRAQGVRAKTMAVLRIAFLSSTVLELFSAIGVAMVAVYVGFSLLGELGFGAYGTPLTLFEGLLLLLLAPEYFQPLRDMAAAWHDRATGQAVAKELGALRQAEPLQMLTPNPAPNPAQAHKPEPSTLAQLSQAPEIRWTQLQIPGAPDLVLPAGHVAAGQAVALTGASGVGKSTLLAALGGVIQPSDGQITIAGQPLTPDSVSALRQMMAWMPQTPYFFTGTLLDNLTLGRPPARPVDDALQLAFADEVVARLHGGLQAHLGEAGAGVSGGEARRLLLARAACQGARIVLADEPTADLDDTTAAQVLTSLLALRDAGATLIAASHDPRLIEAFDRQITL